MRIQIEWLRPVVLREDATRNLIYAVDDARLPVAPGLYVFCRRWGGSTEALYVGTAKNLRGRIVKQLNNLKLMRHMQQAKTGRRVVLPGVIQGRPGQQKLTALKIAERALIRHFLLEGHDIVNVHGTRLAQHWITSVGAFPKPFLPVRMSVNK